MNSNGVRASKSLSKLITKSLIGFFMVITVLLVTASFFLKQGIDVRQLSIRGVELNNCNLVWNEKLELRIDSIIISRDERTSSSKTDFKATGKTLYVSQKLAGFFSLITIEDLSVAGRSAAIELVQKDSRQYLLNLQAEHIDFTSELTFGKDSLVADIVELDMQRFNSTATGQLRLEADSNQLTGTLSALINGSFPVTVDFAGDGEQLSFTGTEAGPIYEIAPLVDLFGLSNNIQRWITDYLKGSRYHLKYFRGQFPWTNPGVLIHTLEAEVRVDDTEYTFAQGLDPIKGEYTDVFFSQGVLAIKPYGGTFYDQDGGDSWLDINFNDPANIILNAYIITDAVANDDIRTLLENYGIPLPFKQIGGTTSTDLTLTINLNKLDIGAEATFSIDEGLVLYRDLIFDISDAHISLENADITLEQLMLSYEDLFSARITGVIQANDGRGNLDISLEKVHFDIYGSALTIDESEANPLISYRYDNQVHELETGPTYWQLGSSKIELGPFQAPVDLKDFSLDLPPVQVDIIPGIQAEISGLLSIKDKTADIKCDLYQFHIKDLELPGKPVTVGINYDQGWKFLTENIAQLSLSNIPVTLYPSEFVLDDESFKVNQSRISYGSFFDSKVIGHFNREMLEGVFHLQNIDVTSEELDRNLEIGDEALVQVSIADGNYVLNSPEFDLWIQSDEHKNWSVYFGDFSKIYSRSRLLQKYEIKKGSLTISSENGSRPYSFSADIMSPYLLLIDRDGPVEELHIRGELTDRGVTATVNEALQIDFIDDTMEIRSNNLGYNIPALINLFNNQPPSSADNDSTEKGLSFSFEADNSHIYFSPKSKILADRIEMEYFNDKIGMRLTHGPGSILLKMQDDHFTAEGSHLNDAFMGALIQNARFHGGQMSIAAAGSLGEFSVLFEIKDTVLGDLKTLNNVMAFINTVPALINFSLPDYNLKGLPLDSAMVGMKFKNKLATFESMEFLSPSLEAAGTGWIDFTEKLMDLDVNLTTKRKINIRNIPLAGYVLQGKNGEASITIKIDGDLSDPRVTHSLYKEIVAKPFNVLFRILKLPIHLLQKMSNDADIQGDTSQTMH